jgi:hypothetical protein
VSITTKDTSRSIGSRAFFNQGGDADSRAYILSVFSGGLVVFSRPSCCSRFASARWFSSDCHHVALLLQNSATFRLRCSLLSRTSQTPTPRFAWMSHVERMRDPRRNQLHYRIRLKTTLTVKNRAPEGPEPPLPPQLPQLMLHRSKTPSNSTQYHRVASGMHRLHILPSECQDLRDEVCLHD